MQNRGIAAIHGGDASGARVTRPIDLVALARAHGTALRRFLQRRLNSAEAADDLSQETYLRLARLGEGEGIADQRGYLFTVAANLARDHQRRQRREGLPEPADRLDVMPCPAPDPERTVAARQELQVLERAIADLPPKTREILLLFRVEGWTRRQIADHLGLSPKTVEYHMQQAMLRCRAAIDG